MAQPRPTLSICIPTRNRRRHLEACLERVLVHEKLPFPIEIVLSDNASEDDTAALARRWIDRGFPIRYHRHAADIGAYANIFSALRRGRGEFALYLADDDRLHVGNLIDAVAWLEANPDCVASYGPIETVDAVDGVSAGLTYLTDADRMFDNRSRPALVSFIVEKRIVPEVGVFRTGALANTLFTGRNIYWAFSLLDRLLGCGSVRFRAQPHYVSLVRQWPGDETRITACQRFGLEEWEACYRGLQLIYYTALVGAGTPADREIRARLEAGVEAFGNYFRNQAIYTIARTGKLADALDVIKLLSGARAIEPHEALTGLAANSAAAALYAVCDVFDQAGDIARIALHGFGAGAGPIAGALKSLRPALDVVDCDDPGALVDPERVLLVVADDSLRERLVGQGFLSGRVLCLRGIIANFDLGPWLDFATSSQ